jgi:hypothetical protein
MSRALPSPLLEPYQKSYIRGIYRLCRKRFPAEGAELAKKRALKWFEGWARKTLGKRMSEALIQEASKYVDELIRAEWLGPAS